MIVRAAAGRVDVLGITDHDESGALGPILRRDHADLGVDIVVGEEISTLNGPLLGYTSRLVPPRLPASKTIGLIKHAQGGWPWPHIPSIRARHGEGHRTIASSFPTFRSTPSRSSTTPASARVLRRLADAGERWRGAFVTAGSDAHDVWYVGNAVTPSGAQRGRSSRGSALRVDARARDCRDAWKHSAAATCSLQTRAWCASSCSVVNGGGGSHPRRGANHDS